ncbi:carboxypeptidase-like regulatory domain-containing protein [Maribacter sp. 2307ULW6-5]|uniref:carboxypeptidase-like regulatory domain-containing protein n=1 Tax=Maribacter sp. 2307ULW6-5 TaxID=3386275 RepID=UPI0039BD6B98
MPLRFLLMCCCLLCIPSAAAQTLTATVVDSTDQRPIPYANVVLNGNGVITNAEGRFSMGTEGVKETDTLYISCIGYAALARPIADFEGSVIALPPKAIELREVIVSNKNYTAQEILERTQDSLEKNFRQGFTKQRLFLRETYHNSIDQAHYSIKESTIPVLNRQFLDSIVRSIPKQDTYYTEVLGDLWGNAQEEEHKIELIKASEMYDKAKRLNYENVEEKMNGIIQQYVKTDSYFKIKSGLFGSKVDVDELFDAEVDSTQVADLNAELEKKKEEKERREKNFALFKRRTLGRLHTSLPIFKDTEYNVLWKPNRYHLTLEDFTYMGDKALYVIRFVPKRSETYRGKLYIDSDDFALVKMEFTNVEPLRNFKLLGISIKEDLAQGSMLFDKDATGRYGLKYLQLTKGNRIGIKRPLQIIEKNKNIKGRRKQNELHLKMDAKFSGKTTYEIVVFNETPVTESAFQGLEETFNVLPQYMPQYDPAFWEGHTIMAPNAAIREFTAMAQE